MGRGAFVMVALGVLAGCVSDNGQPGPKQGDLGGACFANNTCNANLVCVLVNGSGVCQTPDGAAGDATTDQSVADASDSGASDAAGDACGVTLAASRACPNGCTGSSNYCCEQSAMCTPQGQCTTPAWLCQSKSDCSGTTDFCCATGVGIDFGACPPSGQMQTTSQATCQTPCPSGTTPVCMSSADCPQNMPTCVPVSVAGVNVPLGFCH